jgi:hypothetical protein
MRGREVAAAFIRLQRPHAANVVGLSRYEWRRLLEIARMYGWKESDVPRWSTAESADLATALERARIPSRLRPITSKLIPVVRSRGIDLLRGR